MTIHKLLSYLAQVAGGFYKLPGWTTIFPKPEGYGAHPTERFISDLLFQAKRHCVWRHLALAGSVPNNWEWDLKGSARESRLKVVFKNPDDAIPKIRITVG